MAPLDVWHLEYYYGGMSRLRAVMDERGATLGAIAAETGLDLKTVWHAVHGKKLRRSTKKLIAGFFGLPEADIFLDSDIPNAICVQPAQASALR